MDDSAATPLAVAEPVAAPDESEWSLCAVADRITAPDGAVVLCGACRSTGPWLVWASRQLQQAGFICRCGWEGQHPSFTVDVVESHAKTFEATWPSLAAARAAFVAGEL